MFTYNAPTLPQNSKLAHFIGVDVQKLRYEHLFYMLYHFIPDNNICTACESLNYRHNIFYVSV